MVDGCLESSIPIRIHHQGGSAQEDVVENETQRIDAVRNTLGKCWLSI